MSGDAILAVRDLTVRYGALNALTRISVHVAAGEIVALIGPNGAGKTTLLNSISGLLSPAEGAISIEGRDMAARAPHERSNLGVARTFQHARLLDDLSVIENVLLGGYAADRGASDVMEWLRLPSAKARLGAERARAAGILDTLGLAALADDEVRGLSFGRRKLIDLARALMGRPRLLLMDEPTAGLSEAEIERLGTVIETIRREAAILLVAHHMGFVARVADRVVCLVAGAVIADGPTRDVQANPAVLAAYLGDERAMSILSIADIEVSYGGLTALAGVSLDMDRGDIIGVAGPNGAGKSSLLNAIAGLVPLRGGRIGFEDTVLSDPKSRKSMAARQRMLRGVCLVPEGRALFPGLTVEDHLKFGACLVRSTTTAEDLDRVYRLFPKLAERRRQVVDALSGGEKQMVAIGRGLMARPRLLMIDELALGLAPVVVQDLLRVLCELNAATGVSLLLVDESLARLGNSVSRIVFLAHGKVQAVLSPDEARAEAAALYLSAN